MRNIQKSPHHIRNAHWLFNGDDDEEGRRGKEGEKGMEGGSKVSTQWLGEFREGTPAEGQAREGRPWVQMEEEMSEVIQAGMSWRVESKGQREVILLVEVESTQEPGEESGLFWWMTQAFRVWKRSAWQQGRIEGISE